MLYVDGVEFHWLGHDGYKLTVDGRINIYIDPYKISSFHHNKKDADILLISHNHYDHLSIEDIKHVVGDNTTIVAAIECTEQLKSIKPQGIKGMAPGDKLTLQDIKIEAVPAYNTNKDFHPKGDGKIGFIVTLKGMRVYHAGDTDVIAEMRSTEPDIALVPVSGTYVMTAEEAARAVDEKIKPKKLAIPMHYGAIVGSDKDAAKFKELVKTCDVQILQKE